MIGGLGRIRRWIIADEPWYLAIRAFLDFKRDASVIGVRQRFQLARHMRGKPRVRKIELRGFQAPLYYRAGTSDPLVILQVFARKEYSCVAHEPQVESIIDCGANIGCTAFYLLHMYPTARIVVVEPDPDNMELCRRNLAQFHERVNFVMAGVWSYAASMVVDRESYGDNQPWAFQVRKALPDEQPEFTSVTVPEVMDKHDIHELQLLKVDIEAAESQVFRDAEWLSRVKTLVIELHGPECARIVEKACEAFSYERERSGELTVFRGLSIKSEGLSMA